jgi:hypothetical protein
MEIELAEELHLGTFGSRNSLKAQRTGNVEFPTYGYLANLKLGFLLYFG